MNRLCRHASLLVTAIALSAITADPARALWPLPRPTAIEGTVEGWGDDIRFRLDGNATEPVALVGPLANSLRACIGVHVFAEGHLFRLVDGATNSAFDAERLWVDEPRAIESTSFFDGLVTRDGRKLRVGGDVVIARGPLSGVLDVLAGTNFPVAVIGWHSADGVEISSIGVFRHYVDGAHAADTEVRAPHNVARRVLEIYGGQQAGARVRSVAVDRTGRVVEVVIETAEGNTHHHPTTAGMESHTTSLTGRLGRAM